MNKIKNILILITGAIGAFLMLIIQSKNRKVEYQDNGVFIVNEDCSISLNHSSDTVRKAIASNIERLQQIRKR